MRSTPRGALLALACVSVLSLMLSGASFGDATAAPLPPGTRVAYHAETGVLSFVGSAPGSPLARPAGLEPAAAPAAVARAFLEQLGPRLGIQDQASELSVVLLQPAPNGRDVVRFQQVLYGVPVLGGELVVNLDRNGDALSIGGEALPAAELSVVPGITPATARETALGAVASARAAPLPALRAGGATLWIVDSRIVGGPGTGTPTLAWRVDVTGPGLIDELVFVDARRDTVTLHFDQVKRAKNRQVCDAGNTHTQLPCSAPVRTEGGAPGDQEVNDAYDFAGDVYDFYFGAFGRDSLDGAGMTLKSTVRFCTGEPGSSCPWPNAAWVVGPNQMVYGHDYAHADDVVGHELTHGVTSFTSKLISYYQSGAIDESMSDVFGELIDLSNGRGTDTAATRWLMGEDTPIGAIRDMENPPSFGDPDRMGSPLYWTGSSDDGGIHINNGVGNKAAFLMTDGGTFNGRTVSPALGITKTARIYYEADTHLLTSGSDYLDLYNALRQACANLTGTGGITSGDCNEVKDAVDAVEMNVPRADPPAAPLSVVATGGSGSASLSWAPPPQPSHGSSITSYAITPVAGGISQSPTTVGGATTSTTFGGLTNGSSYWFRIKAVTAGGAGPETTSNTVTPKGTQTISFAALPGKTWGDPDFTVGATASSGLSVSFTASGTCTVIGTNVHIFGVGTCTITAAQSGNSAYSAAPSVSQSFTIAKASQTIAYGPLPNRTVGDPDFTVGATSSSGLSVSFAARGSCTISGTRVHLTGAGSCTVTASQAGDSRYDAAPSVSQTFTVSQRKAQIVCRVPKVTGKTLASAKTAIAKGHCRTGKVSYAYAKKIAKGKVVSQSRAVGRVLAANTKVNLLVSRGAKRH